MIYLSFYLSARDFGTLIPEIKGYSRDINPEIELNPKQRTAVMRPGRSIRIIDYDNGDVDRHLAFELRRRERTDQTHVESVLSVICLNQSLQLVTEISSENPSDDAKTIRYLGTQIDRKIMKESIGINLNNVSSDIMYVGFMMNSCSGEKLDSVKKAKCNLSNVTTGIDLASYTIQNDSLKECTTLMMACLYRDSGDWNLRILGKGITGNVFQHFQRFLHGPAPQPAVVPETEIITNIMPSHC